jgi:hypothetical protein
MLCQWDEYSKPQEEDVGAEMGGLIGGQNDQRTGQFRFETSAVPLGRIMPNTGYS